jgi:hypothetical protein
MAKKEKWTVELPDLPEYRQLAYVVDRTNYLEFTIKNIIEKYLGTNPQRSNFVRNVLLHSSVMGLGQKFKVLQYIVAQEGWPAISSDHIHNVTNFRNAFAHSDTATTHIKVKSGKGGANHEIFQILDTLSSSGKVHEYTRDEAFDKFLQSFGALREYLHDLDLNHAAK